MDNPPKEAREGRGGIGYGSGRAIVATPDRRAGAAADRSQRDRPPLVLRYVTEPPRPQQTGERQRKPANFSMAEVVSAAYVVSCSLGLHLFDGHKTVPSTVPSIRSKREADRPGRGGGGVPYWTSGPEPDGRSVLGKIADARPRPHPAQPGQPRTTRDGSGIHRPRLPLRPRQGRPRTARGHLTTNGVQPGGPGKARRLPASVRQPLRSR